MKNPYQTIFRSLNNLIVDSIQKNKSKANEGRKLLEQALHWKLDVPENKKHEASKLLRLYIHEYQARSIQYLGPDLLKRLNKFSHHTKTELSDGDTRKMLTQLNQVLEDILEKKNPDLPPAPETETASSGEGLNLGQRMAVDSDARITLVSAGPGTGKTRLIVDRVLGVLEKQPDRKVIAISFTNRAAEELKDRLAKSLRGKGREDFLEQLFAGTIHAFALDSLRNYFKEFRGEEYPYAIIDEEEFKQIKSDFNNNKTAVAAFLKENDLLTFQDILSQFTNLLNEQEGFAEFVAGTISEIVIDEAQDVSKVQYRIFRRLYDAGKQLSLFLVGDQRQNIFSFIGGSLGHLKKSFSEEEARDEIRKFILKECYRCPNGILKFLNSFSFHDWPNDPLSNPKDTNPTRPNYRELSNKTTEAMAIREKIQQWEGNLNDIAVISNNSFYFAEIAAELNHHRIPFQLFGGETILKPEVRYIKHFLQAVYQQKKYSLQKVILYWQPKTQLRSSPFEDTLAEVKENQLVVKKSLRESLAFLEQHLGSGKAPTELLASYLDLAAAVPLFGEEAIDRLRQLHSLLRLREVTEVDQLNWTITPTDTEMEPFFDRSLDIRYIGEVGHAFVTLSTVHSAKGKEWDLVIVPGMSEDLFPSFRAKTPKDVNSELKKFYVACSRAKKELHLLRPRSYNVPKKDGTGVWTFQKPVSSFLSRPIADGLVQVND